MALPLTGYLNREGRYAGFDVSREAIAWCTENISGSHPNFEFTAVDIQNGAYNPTGKYESSDFRFPYLDIIRCSAVGLIVHAHSAIGR